MTNSTKISIKNKKQNIIKPNTSQTINIKTLKKTLKQTQNFLDGKTTIIFKKSPKEMKAFINNFNKTFEGIERLNNFLDGKTTIILKKTSKEMKAFMNNFNKTFKNIKK